MALSGLNIGTGSDVLKSGEAWVINYLKNHLSKDAVLFDVGANVGDYSIALRRCFPFANIFAFEPSSINFQNLDISLTDKNVITFNIGFGESEGNFALYSNQRYSGISSLFNRQLTHLDIEMQSFEEVEIKSIDKFCMEQAISNIHLLKLDTEGSEFSILKGAKKMIESDKIQYIQFEFGGCNIDSRTYFKDFFYLLSPKYRLFRILQDGLQPIENYSEDLEVFLTTNFLAKHKNLA